MARFQVRDIRKSPFVWYNKAIIERYGAILGVYGHAVYSALAMYADNTQQTCYPSYDKIAGLYGMSRRQVIREIEKLEKLGLLRIEKQVAPNDMGHGRETNIFTLLDIPTEMPVVESNSGDMTTSDYQSPVTTSHQSNNATSDYQSPPLVTTSHPNYTHDNYTHEDRESVNAPTPITPKPSKNPKSVAPFMDNEAVLIYKDLAHNTPVEAVRAEIAARVTNLSKWRDIVTDWVMHGYNPRNLRGMLDKYDGKPYGVASGKSEKTSMQAKIDDIHPAYKFRRDKTAV